MTAPLVQDARLIRLQQLVQAENWPEALALAEPLVHDHTLATTAHAWLAIVYGKQGRTSEALQHGQQAFADHPDDALIAFNLGTLTAQQGDLTTALSYCEQAVSHCTDWPTAHYNVGTVLLRLTRYRDAIRAFEQATMHDRDYPEAHFNRGNAHALLGLRDDGTLDYYELDCAITAYKMAIQQRPGYAAALYNLGMLYQRRRSSEGLRVWEQYLDVTQDRAEEAIWRVRAVEYTRDLQDHLR